MPITTEHSQCDAIIQASLILTQNENRDILRDSALAIKDGHIAAVGSAAEILGAWIAPTILDYPHHILTPGLINSHSHASMTFLRGLAEDMPLLKWLQETVFPLEANLSPEIVQLGSLLGFAEMLACGITSVIDMYIFENAVFEAAALAGLRCMGGEAIFEFPSAAFESWRDALSATEALAEKYSGNDRIKIAVNPHSVYTTTPEILRNCLTTARRHDLPIHIHLSESESESRMCQERWGCRPISWLEQNGFFENRVIAAHMVDITPEEIAFLADKPLTPVHNPSSNMKLASGLAPVAEMLAEKMPVALGTDGPASNNALNLISEMKLAALLQKNRMADPAILPAGAVFDMATLNGAKAFGDARLGAIMPGKKADLAVFNTRYPQMQPLHDPVAQLVYAANGSECVMTMVGGEMLYQNGQYSRFDIKSLYDELYKFQAFIAAHTGRRNK